MTRVITVEGIALQWIGLEEPVPLLTAIGTVNSLGWSRFELSAWRYFKTPEDRIQDFDFVGLPPGSLNIPANVPVVGSAILTQPVNDYWGDKDPLLGVRVHASSNSKTLDLEPIKRVAKRKSQKTGEFFRLESLQLSLGDDDPYPLALLPHARAKGKTRDSGLIFKWIAQVVDPKKKHGVEVMDPLSKFYAGADPALILPDAINNHDGFEKDKIGVSVGELRGVETVFQVLTIMIHKYQKTGWTVL